MDSILTLIKRLLGIDEQYGHFDVDIIIGINNAFMTLQQLGIGPKEGFLIQDQRQTWTEFLCGRTDLEAVKMFVYLKTKLSFDPPQTSYLIKAIEDQLNELTFRLNIQAETPT